MADDVKITGIDESAKQALTSAVWGSEAIRQRIFEKLLNNRSSTTGSAPTAIQRQTTRYQENYNRSIYQSYEHTKKWNQEIFGASKSISGFTNGLKNIKNAFMGSSTIAAAKSLTGEQGKFEDLIKGVGGDLSDFGKIFGGILKPVGWLAASLGLLFKGVTATIAPLRQSMELQQALYSSGISVEAGFRTLATTSMATGISMQNLVEIMTKFGGVAVTLGTKRLMDLQSQFAKSTKLGSEFYMSQQQSQEAFMDAMEIMRTSQELSGMTEDQIVLRGRRTINMFNELSQATGRNRDELRKNTVEALKTTEMYGLQRNLGIQGSKQLQEVTASLQATFGKQGSDKITSMLEAMMMGGPALISEQFRPLLAIVPGFGRELETMSREIRDGTISPQDVATRLTGIFQGMDEKNMTILRAAEPQLANWIREMQQASDQAQQRRQKLESETEIERAKRVKEEEEQRKIREAFNTMDSVVNTVKATMSSLLTTAVQPFIGYFKDSAGGLNTLVTSLENNLQPYIAQFSNWLKNDILPNLDKELGQWIKNIATAFQNIVSIDWTGLTTKLKEWSDYFIKWEFPSTGTLVAAAAGLLALPAILSLITAVAMKAAMGAGTGAVGGAGGGKSAMGKVGVAGALAVGGFIADKGAEYVSEQLRGSGHEVAAEAVDILGDVAKGAMTGAAIGSMIPIVGTAVGAAVGGATAGIVSTLSRAKSGGPDLTGMAEFGGTPDEVPHPYIGMNRSVEEITRNATNLNDTTVTDMHSDLQEQNKEEQDKLDKIIELMTQQLVLQQAQKLQEEIQNKRMMLTLEAGLSSQ